MLLATFLITFALLRTVAGCMQIQPYFGRLDASLLLSSVTLPYPSQACSCCGLCHQHSGCKSLSFSAGSRECLLYGTVGNYGNFSREWPDDHSTEFYIMPNSSKTGEFCRYRSDCTTADDTCLGHTCTTARMITCQTIHRQNSGLPDHRYWGAIEGEQVLLYCLMQKFLNGYTMLLSTGSWGEWTTSNRLNLTTPGFAYQTWRRFSMLWAADIIKNSGGNEYRVLVSGSRTYKHGSSNNDRWTYETRAGQFTARRAVSLLGSLPQLVEFEDLESDFTFDNSLPSFPYLMDNDGILYHMNMDRSSMYGALVRTSGGRFWADGTDVSDHMYMYIRE